MSRYKSILHIKQKYNDNEGSDALVASLIRKLGYIIHEGNVIEEIKLEVIWHEDLRELPFEINEDYDDRIDAIDAGTTMVELLKVKVLEPMFDRDGNHEIGPVEFIFGLYHGKNTPDEEYEAWVHRIVRHVDTLTGMKRQNGIVEMIRMVEYFNGCVKHRFGIVEGETVEQKALRMDHELKRIGIGYSLDYDGHYFKLNHRGGNDGTQNNNEHGN